MSDINRLKNYIPYGIKLDIENNLYILRLTFDENWYVSKPEDKRINIYKNNDTTYSFTTSLENNIDILFDNIDFIIEFNNELKLKQALLLKKIEELKRIFIETKYEKLETIEFTFKKKNRTKRSEEAPITNKEENELNNDIKPEVSAENEENIDEKIKEAINKHDNK